MTFVDPDHKWSRIIDKDSIDVRSFGIWDIEASSAQTEGDVARYHKIGARLSWGEVLVHHHKARSDRIGIRSGINALETAVCPGEINMHDDKPNLQ